MEIEQKLKRMGLELPNPPVPAANYIGCVRVGNLLFVGGNIGRINEQLKYSGKVGDKVTLEQGYEAARNCALNHLAIIKSAIGDLAFWDELITLITCGGEFDTAIAEYNERTTVRAVREKAEPA